MIPFLKCSNGPRASALSTQDELLRNQPESVQDSFSSVSVLGRHGSDSLCRDERENKMAATYNVLAFKR